MSESTISPRAGAPFYGGVFIISASVLMLQILYTRLLSVMSYYHLAFFAISIAMFGMTAGAVWVYLQAGRFNRQTLARDLTRFASAYAASVGLSLLLQVGSVPVLALSATTVVVWMQVAIIMSVPFFCAGVVISLALTRSPFPVGRVYAADLVGAAVGCLGVLALLDIMDGPSAILAVGGVAALGAVTFSRAAADEDRPLPAGLIERILARPAMIAGVLLVLAAANSTTRYGIQPIVVKNEVDRRDNVAFEKWNSFSRILVRRPWKAAPVLWGASSTLPPGTEVEQYRLNIDGDAATSMFRFSGDVSQADFLRYDITNLAYTIRNTGRAAIIGVGGGRDMLSARVHGFPDVTGVEINPIFIDLLTNREPYRSFAKLADQPGMHFNVDEARSWFARSPERFDLIQMSMIDTFAATGAGAFTLTENGLYTLEGWRIFVGHLAPRGVFTVSRWYAPGDVNETGRMISLAVAALLDQGITEPRKHLFLASNLNLATLVLSREPLTGEESQALQATAAKYKYNVLLSPGRQPATQVLADITASQDQRGLEAATAGYLFDLSPPGDNRPFFFNQLRLGRWFEGLHQAFSADAGVVRGNIVATLTLVVIMLVSVILVVTTIVLPLRPAVKNIGGRFAVLGSLYFLLLGVGFMLVEIALLERLSVFLGHPIYALSIVLFSIIVCTGMGSFVSEKFPLDSRGRFAAWSLTLGIYLAILPWLIPSVVGSFESATLPARAGLSILLIAPAGLLLGFGFPTGMRLISARDSRPTPWFWGVNGAGSVLGSACAVAISMTFGISTTLTLGACCYLATLPVGVMLAEVEPAVERLKATTVAT